MSHFTVVIIGENPEEQLAPFDEEIEVPEYKKKVVSKKDKQMFINLYTTDSSNRDYAPITKEEAKVNKKLSFDKLYEKYSEDWNGNVWRKDANGEWSEYSTYNPNSKWDWYVLGGRWRGFFKAKKEKKGICGDSGGLYKIEPTPGWYDQLKKGDIDFQGMRNLVINKAIQTYKKFEKKFKEDPKCKNFNPYFDFGVENKGNRNNFIPESREEYINRQKHIAPYAVIKNGKWHEKGQMGWFGMSSNDKKPRDWEEEFISLFEDVSDDTLVSVFDCHI